MAMPRLLVTDVDRTILTHDHMLPSRVKEQLARAKEAGVLLVLATARSPIGVRPYADQLGPDWTICFNGGWTGDPKSGAALRRSLIVALTVASATPEVRPLAHYVAPSCDVGGMADAVAWLLCTRTAAEAV